MDGWIIALATVLGVLVGYFPNLYLERRKSRYQLRHAIAGKTVEAYMDLWKLTSHGVYTRAQRSKRLEEIGDWYRSGGGLFLSWDATKKIEEIFFLLRVSQAWTRENQEDLYQHFEDIRTILQFDGGVIKGNQRKEGLPRIKEEVLKEAAAQWEKEEEELKEQQDAVIKVEEQEADQRRIEKEEQENQEGEGEADQT